MRAGTGVRGPARPAGALTRGLQRQMVCPTLGLSIDNNIKVAYFIGGPSDLRGLITHRSVT